MIRTAEAVLDGHPDRFCDLLADAILAEGYQADPDCYAQIETAVWSDAVWFSGVMIARKPMRKTVRMILRELAKQVGYTGGDRTDVGHYRIFNEIVFIDDDPLRHTGTIGDQSIVVGWAGYDRKTHFLPPEHFLVHRLRRDVIDSFRKGPLSGQGPDGKILVIVRESGGEFVLEEVILTLQHRGTTDLSELRKLAAGVFSESYSGIRQNDPRWTAEPNSVNLLINPNGELTSAGSESDNGQTGRKLVMDYYGPRVPIGGGALAGKCFTHIDRLGACTARKAAIKCVVSGAVECKITLVYAPGRNEPLDVIYDLSGKGNVIGKEHFSYDRMKQENPFSPSHLLGFGQFSGIF